MGAASGGTAVPQAGLVQSLGPAVKAVALLQSGAEVGAGRAALAR